MLRRLATIATALALVGCSDGFNAPTGVPRQLNIDDRTTVPPDLCVDYLVDDTSALIPSCVNVRPWPVDGLENRARHGYEAVTAGGAGQKGIRF
jgi:hypothetical protein